MLDGTGGTEEEEEEDAFLWVADAPSATRGEQHQ